MLIKKYFAFILMHLGFFIYSFYIVIGKIAANYASFSVKWSLLYCLIIFLLGIYAILWQQVLKNFRLPVAICNKAITIVWGMTFSCFIFKETITIKKIVGAIIILCGIFLLSIADSKKGAN